MATEHRLVIIIEGRDQASGALNNVGGSLQRIGEFALGGLLASAIASIGNALEGLASRAFNSVANIQQLRVSLETLAAREIAAASGTMTVGEAMGQAVPMAQDLMAQLRDISLVSPFEYEDVASILRVNMAFGATSQTAMGLTKAILNTAAAMGMDNSMLDRFTYNLAQALTMGDLTAANLRQLKMVGFDLADVFEKELGMSIEQVRDALESGALTAEDVSQAFMNYAENNFGGAAERLSRTVKGLQSSFNDLFTFAAADLLSPAMEVVGEALGGLFDLGREGLESGVFAQLGEQLAQSVRGAIAAIKELVAAFQSGGIGGGAAKIAEMLGLDPALAAQIGAVVNQVVGIIGQIVAWVQANWPMIQAITAQVWTTVGGIIGTVAGKIGGFIGQIVAWFQANWPMIQAIVQTAWTVIQAVIQAAVDVIWPAIQSFFSSIQENAGAFQSIWESLQAIAVPILEAVGAAIVVVIGVIAGVFNGVAQAIGPFVQTIAAVLANIVGIFQGVITFITGFVNMIVALFQGNSAGVQAALNQMWQGVVQIWNNLVSGIVNLVTGLWDTLVALVGGIVEGIVQFFVNLYNELIGNSIVVDLVNDIIAWFASLPGALLELIQQAVDWVTGKFQEFLDWVTTVDLLAEGERVLQSLWDGLVNIWDSVSAWFSGLFESIRQVFAGFDMIAIGTSLVNGVLEGLQNAWDSVVNWLAGAFEQIYADILAFFGISSPSKLMFEVGKNITRGTLLGMQSIQLTPPLPSADALRGYAQGSQTTDNRTFNGDAITVNVTDRDSADYLLAMLEDRRRQRLAAFMGA